MVNLSQTATLEDRISPEGRAAFDAFYTSLTERKAGDFKALHIFSTPDQLVSVDFGVSVGLVLPPRPYAKREWPCLGALRSAAMSDLMVMADAELSLYDPGEVITPLSRTEWWDFWIGDFLGMRPMLMPHSFKGRVFVILRGAVL